LARAVVVAPVRFAGVVDRRGGRCDARLPLHEVVRELPSSRCASARAVGYNGLEADLCHRAEPSSLSAQSGMGASRMRSFMRFQCCWRGASMRSGSTTRTSTTRWPEARSPRHGPYCQVPRQRVRPRGGQTLKAVSGEVVSGGALETCASDLEADGPADGERTQDQD